MVKNIINNKSKLKESPDAIVHKIPAGASNISQKKSTGSGLEIPINPESISTLLSAKSVSGGEIILERGKDELVQKNYGYPDNVEARFEYLPSSDGGFVEESKNKKNERKTNKGSKMLSKDKIFVENHRKHKEKKIVKKYQRYFSKSKDEKNNPYEKQSSYQHSNEGSSFFVQLAKLKSKANDGALSISVDEDSESSGKGRKVKPFQGYYSGIDDDLTKLVVDKNVTKKRRFLLIVLISDIVLLAVTAVVASLFFFVGRFRRAAENNEILICAVSFILFLLTYCCLTFKTKIKTIFPVNYGALLVMALGLGMFCGVISTSCACLMVITALGLTLIVLVVTIIVIATNKVDVSGNLMWFLLVFFCLLVFGGVTGYSYRAKAISMKFLIGCLIGSIIFSMCLWYYLQKVLGNKELTLSHEENVKGALALYVDIVFYIIAMEGAKRVL